MAINQLQIPTSGNINNLVDQSQWQSLSNLGNVYQKAQQDAANQQAFAQFQQTGDPKALIGSGDMNLAQLGVNAQNHMDTLRQQDITNKRADETQGFLRAEAARKAYDAEHTPDRYKINSDGTFRDLYAEAATAEAVKRAAEEAKAKGDVPTIIGAGSSVIVPNKAQEGAIFTNKSTAADYGTDLIDSLADRLQKGDATWKTGLARDSGLIRAVETEVAKRGVAAKAADPSATPAEDILQARANQAGRVREQGTLGTASANNTLYGNAAAATMQTAIEMSAKVPRTSYVPLNRLIQTGQTALSDPDLAELRTATNTLVNDYVKATTPVGSPTDSQRAHAYEMLDMATDHPAFVRVVKLMHREIENTHKAIEFTKQQLQSGKGGGIPPLDAAAQPGGASDNLAAARWASQNPNDPRAQAIIQHLKGQGQ